MPKLPRRTSGPCAGELTVARSADKQGEPKGYSIEAGDSEKVKARLSRNDRRKLSRRGELTASATSVEQGEFGDKTTVQTLELEARGKRHT